MTQTQTDSAYHIHSAWPQVEYQSGPTDTLEPGTPGPEGGPGGRGKPEPRFRRQKKVQAEVGGEMAAGPQASPVLAIP